MQEYNSGFARPNVEDEKTPVFIFSTAFDYLHNNEVNRINGFPYHQFLQCVEGCGTLYIYGKSYIIHKNTAFLLPKDVPHRYVKSSEPWLLDWIVFSGSCLEQIMTSLNIPQFAVYEKGFSIKIHQTIQNIVKLYQKKPRNRAIVSSPLAYETLLNIKTLSDIPDRLAPVIDYIFEHIQDEITLQDLSNLINITPEHLCRLFKSELNMRPFEYINLERVQFAKQLLYESSLKISEISHLCGFTNENYFREIFKKQVGVSPSHYKNRF